MNNGPLSQADLDSIFSRLDPQDVEQFHQGFQRWKFEQRIATLRAEIDDLQRRLAENRAAMQQVAPSPIALASLARLQLHDVSDPALLDRLLARGDDWLDRTIEHLDYCERMGLIGEDYTQWCEHALEGAYDWIDSLNGTGSAADGVAAAEATFAGDISTPDETRPQTTEEMMLQKLMSEENDEPTYKLAAVPITPVLHEDDSSSEAITPISLEDNASVGEITFPTHDTVTVDEIALPAQDTEAAGDSHPSEQISSDVVEGDKPAPEAVMDENIQHAGDVSLLQEGDANAPSVQDERIQPAEDVSLPGESNAYASPVREEINTNPPTMQNRDKLAGIDTLATQPTMEANKTPLPPRPRRKRTFWQRLLGR